MTPTASEAKTIPLQSTVFNLDTMEDVLLFKEVSFAPVTSTKEALERLGNDAAKFLAVINEGLESETRRAAKGDSSIPWLTEDEEGNRSEFVGTPADSKAVNSLVLTLAKTIFGYSKDADADKKRAAKQNAFEMIKTNDAIRAGLKQNAAA